VVRSQGNHFSESGGVMDKNPWDTMTTFAPKSCVGFFAQRQLDDEAAKERRLRARLPVMEPRPVRGETFEEMVERWCWEDSFCVR